MWETLAVTHPDSFGNVGAAESVVLDEAAIPQYPVTSGGGQPSSRGLNTGGLLRSKENEFYAPHVSWWAWSSESGLLGQGVRSQLCRFWRHEELKLLS